MEISKFFYSYCELLALHIYEACICRGRRSSLLHFDENMGGINDGSRMPFFIADITLAIPNVVSKRTLKTKDYC